MPDANVPERPIRVMLVCEQPMLLAGLRLLLEAEPAITVVDRADLRNTTGIDVLILDLDGESAERLVFLSPTTLGTTRLLVLASVLDHDVLGRALQHGATGAILKSERPEALIESVRRVFRGEICLDASATAHLLGDLTEPLGPRHALREKAALLTARERDVASLVGTGLRNAQIAKRLSLSEVTVRNHLTAIFRKLRVRTRLELALLTFSTGLCKMPMKAMSSTQLAKNGAKLPEKNAS